MSIHVALHHRTSYTYDRLIALGPQTIRLRPAPHCRTKILSYSLTVEPAGHFLNWQQDSHANYLARLVFPEKTEKFDVCVDVVAEMAVYNPFDFFLEPYAETFPFKYEPWLKKDLAPFLEWEETSPKLLGYIEPWVGKKDIRTIDFLVGLNAQMQQDISYLIRMEPGVQTVEDTLTSRSGSCRDTGWLLVNALRRLGFAARFVSGYLIQLKADVKALDGPSGTDVDFTDLHAWCEVYLPGAGWIGLDPTSGLLAGEGHIPLACTPEPMTAAPVSGALDEAESTMFHEMNVTRIYESPRVTKPYTEEQWAEILKSGRAVDERLRAGDVRLTMGGEPTFISIDDPDGEEWNYAANGKRKRELSGELIKRLRKHFAPSGGLLHYGQGKWYPGEPLPRWSLGCWWRKDGEPIWQNPDLIADERKNYAHGAAEAKLLADKLMAHLGVDSQWLLPAYEDVYYYIWRERRLPVNVDPLNSNLNDKLERDGIRRIFEQGLGSVVGYALPLERVEVGDELEWTTGPWFLRRETLYLTPGDSPMGLRLPLDSLPWAPLSELPYRPDPDPMEERSALPPRRNRSAQMHVAKGEGTSSSAKPTHATFPYGADSAVAQKAGSRPKLARASAATTREPEQGRSAPWIVRSALCVEPRNGRLHVFMPPVKEIEDYLDLVAAIEDAAADLNMPVILEGDPPPHDPRLSVLKVTPDPGVIEVNVHPSASWDELVEKTTIIYDEARLTRLGTEKFMVDGRHTGTGGGNHIIMGGDTPADSPVLRRPDLLRSLLNYWHNHPSLSFLFSGLFIGPTSQAPRVDEARNDSLYELQLAFDQVPEAGKYIAPWVVDRLFRHLLIDATGNTHRSEFCIDKLYSPDSSTGRLGLVELRSYEMPPDARMSIAQHLMLRSLIAKFWEEPYKAPLVRWGTAIHDRWMLPHFIWSDFGDVISDLKSSGLEMQPEWFAPHYEFRFPRIGAFSQKNVEVQFRTALEPWHVLGEENGGSGTVRYVDSSLERMEVKVKGMVDPRHVVTVNGRRLPLHPTGVNGEFVCGVRYRAWQPPECLHPLIGIHAPLTFDLVDTWNNHSLGGCRYHVTHPGGRSYDTFPVNAFEAESRRLARFEDIGHTPGAMVPPAPPLSREFPFTLDLRA
jgi:uncharacterized protein (DUF2126 family)/transglutaminase-like putative cysteine protease